MHHSPDNAPLNGMAARTTQRDGGAQTRDRPRSATCAQRCLATIEPALHPSPCEAVLPSIESPTSESPARAEVTDPATISRRALLGTGGAVVAGTALAFATGTGTAAASPSASPTSDPANLPALRDIPHRAWLVDYEVVELAALLRAGRTTSVQITQAYLDRIATLNGPFEVYGDNGLYNAFVRIDADAALVAARAADKRLRAARRGLPVPLICGIPIGVKDSV